MENMSMKKSLNNQHASQQPKQWKKHIKERVKQILWVQQKKTFVSLQVVKKDRCFFTATKPKK